ncbi:MAG TPA: AMP-binding protein [Streptosporangiaceae bacterium]
MSEGTMTPGTMTPGTSQEPRWDWDAAARSAGATQDGTFNAATMPLPGQPAVIWRRADGSSAAYSGDQLRRRGAEIAAVLTQLGVRRGDRVAGLIGRRPASFAAALGAWHLGAVYVPMFSGFGGDGLKARLADCGPAAAITDTASRPGLDAVADILPDLRILVVDGAGEDGDTDMRAAIERGVDLAGPAATGLHDTSTIMYTSGTTGRPKGCQIPHHAVLTLAPYVRDFLALNPGDVLFSGADAGWSFGLFTTGFAPMAKGIARVIYEGPFDPAGWWDTVSRLSAGHLAAAPTAFRQLAAAGPGLLPAQFTAGSSAGEPLDAATIDWFRDRAGVVVHDSYGLSELGMVIGNLRTPGAPAVEPGCMGTALPGFDVALIGPDGEPVSGEGAGRIAVKDNSFLLSSGYWGRTDEWNARFAGEWFITEDIARRDEHGRYWFVGRADDVIVSSGYNVGPAEVETALLRHGLVSDAACVGEPDPVRGTVVAAHVVLAGPAPDDLLAELRQCVGAGVGWYAAPRRLHVHDSLPRTDSGKIQRHLLRQQGGNP